MSSFLISEQTMANLAETLACVIDYHQNYAYYYPDAFAKPFMECKDKNGDTSVRTIGKLLFEMNDHALRQRYKNEWWLEDIDLEKEYVFFAKGINLLHKDKFQLLKSLRCYLYQCSEGDTTEWELFKALEKFGSQIEDDIILNLKEYDDAEWG